MKTEQQPLKSPMAWSYLNAVLRALPNYAVVRATDEFGKTWRLMARDMPGTSDRRFTNLDSGMEWFVNEDGWNVIVEITIDPMLIQVVQ